MINDLVPGTLTGFLNRVNFFIAVTTYSLGHQNPCKLSMRLIGHILRGRSFFSTGYKPSSAVVIRLHTKLIESVNDFKFEKSVLRSQRWVISQF